MRKFHLRTRRRKIVAMLALLACIAAGVAYAYISQHTPAVQGTGTLGTSQTTCVNSLTYSAGKCYLSVGNVPAGLTVGNTVTLGGIAQNMFLSTWQPYGSDFYVNPTTNGLLSAVTNPAGTVSLDATHVTAGCLASWFTLGNFRWVAGGVTGGNITIASQPTLIPSGAVTYPTNAGLRMPNAPGVTSGSYEYLSGALDLTFTNNSTAEQSACDGATVTVSITYQ
jgi:hypothetical protein